MILSGYLSPGPYGASPTRTSASAATSGATDRRQLRRMGHGGLRPRFRLSSPAGVPWCGCSSSWPLVAMWLSLGAYLLGGTLVLDTCWLPVAHAGQAAGLEGDPARSAGAVRHALPRVHPGPRPGRILSAREELRARSTPSGWRCSPGWPRFVIALAALVPVFITFDMPFTVQSTAIPLWMAHDAPLTARPAPSCLTVPFAVSGSDRPMLWQAVDDMHFRLAGAGLKTPECQRRAGRDRERRARPGGFWLT